MRSARSSSDGSRYKILFIVALLLLAIVGVLYLMKMQEVSSLSETLVEAKKEADGTQWGLNQKVTELQQKLETQTTELKECEKKVTALGTDSDTSKKTLAKCGEDLANLQKARDDLQERMTEADTKKEELEMKVDDLQNEVALERKKADTCNQQLAESQAGMDKCSQSADAIKAQLLLCTQNCQTGVDTGKAPISNPVRREQMQAMPFSQPQPRAPSQPEHESPDPGANVALGEAQEAERDLSPKESDNDYTNEQKPDNVVDEF